MRSMKIFSILPWADWLALVCFFALWIGYAWFARVHGQRRSSLLVTTNRYRGYWMKQAAMRDPWAAAGSVDTDLSFLSLLELYGTEIAERRMPSRRVVEALDVVEYI